jgi:hypothetical protein
VFSETIKVPPNKRFGWEDKKLAGWDAWKPEGLKDSINFSPLSSRTPNFPETDNRRDQIQSVIASKRRGIPAL